MSKWVCPGLRRARRDRPYLGSIHAAPSGIYRRVVPLLWTFGFDSKNQMISAAYPSGRSVYLGIHRSQRAEAISERAQRASVDLALKIGR